MTVVPTGSGRRTGNPPAEWWRVGPFDDGGPPTERTNW
jgi:hypothetical protein